VVLSKAIYQGKPQSLKWCELDWEHRYKLPGGALMPRDWWKSIFWLLQDTQIYEALYPTIYLYLQWQSMRRAIEYHDADMFTDYNSDDYSRYQIKYHMAGISMANTIPNTMPNVFQDKIPSILSQVWLQLNLVIMSFPSWQLEINFKTAPILLTFPTEHAIISHCWSQEI